MIRAIGKEISDRESYVNEQIHTVYFGGGTPSILSTEQITFLLNTIDKNFDVDSKAEVTLEANPEDLTSTKAKDLFKSGINRLSIGIQTFDDSKLTWMNRIHSANESVHAFENVRAAGFENVSLDLIYAIPDHSQEKWGLDLEAVIDLQPEHISLYGLTIEEKTVFGKWEQNNKLVQVPEDEAASQYLFAIEYLKSQGYKQYEVSNFGKEGFHSRHNHSYWSGIPYLGVGPGAHSYNGKSRRFNVRNNPKYIQALKGGDSYFESEELSRKQRINEQILTRLRTAQGLNLERIRNEAGEDLETLHPEFIEQISQQGLIEIKDGFLSLKEKGFLVADEIALRLFFAE